MVPIASFVPNIVALDNVDALLRSNSVPYVVEGSRSYLISVPTNVVHQARNALKRAHFADKLTFYP